jgi:hypothetical protein
VQPTRRRHTDRDADMAAATIARRAFVAAVLARGPSQAMVEFARVDMASTPYDDTPLSEEVVAQITFGSTDRLDEERPVAAWPGGAAGRAHGLPNVLFALVACGIESAWSDRAWRDPDPRRVRYLRLLGEHGYTLTAIERQMCKTPASPRSPKRTSAGGA